eukprot:9794746-Alexandrium_andersonii.AAC.1
MRHLERTHHVSVKWLHEQTQNGRVAVEKVESAAQAADVFTKPFVDKVAWTAVRPNVLLVDVGSFWRAPRDGGGAPPVHLSTSE